MTPFADPLLQTAALAPAVGVLLTTAPRSAWRYAALLLLAFALDGVLTRAGLTLGLNPPLRWNWVGKSFSSAGSLTFLHFSRLTGAEVGLTLRQRPGSLAPCGVVVLVMTLAAFLGGGRKPRPEALLFQATMPGLAEELAYRGAMLALLVRAFGESGPPWRAVAGTSLGFGLVHSLVAGPEGQFRPGPFAATATAGAVLAWVRLRTGSLAVPVLAHNLVNAAGMLRPW